MILSKFLFENINGVDPDLKIFLWVGASVANAAAVSSNCTKTLLANGVRTLFVNGLNKLGNPTSWVAIFLAVPFYKNELFSKDLIIFIISFVSLFVRVIPVPKILLKSGITFLKISAVLIAP